ncbi:hypothetical protein [Campylobacter lanienae]|uniref:hypothetical protein n=1 Tax=Campylobacter lanienae TaxID=75658 RepID=UPI0015D6A90D|nr:hypothetical protein [Campylobacter lanienae]
MIESVWQYLEDDRNLPSRLNTVIKLVGGIDLSNITTELLLNLKRNMMIMGINW